MTTHRHTTTRYLYTYSSLFVTDLVLRLQIRSNCSTQGHVIRWIFTYDITLKITFL